MTTLINMLRAAPPRQSAGIHEERAKAIMPHIMEIIAGAIST